MQIRKILMDGPIGKVFTNITKTSDGTAANLIAGTIPKVFQRQNTTVVGVPGNTPDWFINLYKGIATHSVTTASFINTYHEGGVITEFNLVVSPTNSLLVDMLFYNKITKTYRRVINPNPKVPSGVSPTYYASFYTIPGSWYGGTLTTNYYKNLSISFNSDELLVIRVVKRSNINVVQTISPIITYYTGNLGI